MNRYSVVLFKPLRLRKYSCPGSLKTLVFAKGGKTLTAVEYATSMISMIRRKPDMSLQARCSVAVIMFILGFSLNRCHSLTVASRTRKAITYWSVESAEAVS